MCSMPCCFALFSFTFQSFFFQPHKVFLSSPPRSPQPETFFDKWNWNHSFMFSSFSSVNLFNTWTTRSVRVEIVDNSRVLKGRGNSWFFLSEIYFFLFKILSGLMCIMLFSVCWKELKWKWNKDISNSHDEVKVEDLMRETTLINTKYCLIFGWNQQNCTEKNSSRDRRSFTQWMKLPQKKNNHHQFQLCCVSSKAHGRESLSLSSVASKILRNKPKLAVRKIACESRKKMWNIQIKSFSKERSPHKRVVCRVLCVHVTRSFVFCWICMKNQLLLSQAKVSNVQSNKKKCEIVRELYIDIVGICHAHWQFYLRV